MTIGIESNPSEYEYSGQVTVWKHPGTEVWNNRIWLKVGPKVDMEEIHSCRYQAFGVGAHRWLAGTEQREPAILVVVGNYHTRTVYGRILRFSACAGTVACGQDEDSVVTAIPRVFDCDALSEQWCRHMTRKVTAAVFDAAYTLNFDYEHLVALV